MEQEIALARLETKDLDKHMQEENKKKPETKSFLMRLNTFS